MRGPPARRHNVTTRLLHWLVGGLLVYGLVFPADGAALSDPFALRTEVVFALTLAILFLIRFLGAATVGGGSRLPADASAWEHMLSRMVHYGIYAAVPAITITGLIIALTADAAHTAFGFAVPASAVILPQGVLLDVHEALATGLIFLIGLHVAGAVWHWIVRRDGAWHSMLWGGPRPSSAT